MILISHRGNLSGPDPTKENSPSYILAAIAANYDVEIDLRMLDGKLYLGHDRADYQVVFDWLLSLRDKLWIHCKNYEAIKFMSECQIFRWFCHQNDMAGIVMDGYFSGYLWYSDLSSLPHPKCIIPLLSREQVDAYPKEFLAACGGVCSDYIEELRNNL